LAKLHGPFSRRSFDRIDVICAVNEFVYIRAFTGLSVYLEVIAECVNVVGHRRHRSA